jgi:signal transduction histidine kinase
MEMDNNPANSASRISSSPGSEPGEFEVAELLAEIALEVETMMGPDIMLDIVARSAIPRVSCSRDRLRDAVIQLLANAREALPAGGTISIEASNNHRSDARAVELRIVDNGIGMERETLRRAVEPFFTTKATGLGGLGLTIVGHFADEIGGRLHLHSELGIGTRATLFLPLSGGPAR